MRPCTTTRSRRSALPDPLVHTTCVPAARGRVADEVEGDDVVGQAGDRLEELDDPLPWQPVRDADGGHEAPSSEAGSIEVTGVVLACRTAGRDVQVLAGRDDPESIAAADQRATSSAASQSLATMRTLQARYARRSNGARNQRWI